MKTSNCNEVHIQRLPNEETRKWEIRAMHLLEEFFEKNRQSHLVEFTKINREINFEDNPKGFDKAIMFATDIEPAVKIVYFVTEGQQIYKVEPDLGIEIRYTRRANEMSLANIHRECCWECGKYFYMGQNEYGWWKRVNMPEKRNYTCYENETNSTYSICSLKCQRAFDAAGRP